VLRGCCKRKGKNIKKSGRVCGPELRLPEGPRYCRVWARAAEDDAAAALQIAEAISAAADADTVDTDDLDLREECLLTRTLHLFLRVQVGAQKKLLHSSHPSCHPEEFSQRLCGRNH
jgi:hypothetical protein